MIMMIIFFMAASPMIILAVHMIVARIRRGGSPQLAAVWSVAAGAVPVAAILWWSVLRHIDGSGPTAAASLYCAITYGALGYTYFHFFNMSETARRIRILSEIHRAGTLAHKDMESLYKTTDIITIRLARLVSLGQLSCQNGYYSIRGRTLYWSGRAILLWRSILGLGSSDV